jgi:hypothetical protein
MDVVWKRKGAAVLILGECVYNEARDLLAEVLRTKQNSCGGESQWQTIRNRIPVRATPVAVPSRMVRNIAALRAKGRAAQ